MTVNERIRALAELIYESHRLPFERATFAHADLKDVDLKTLYERCNKLTDGLLAAEGEDLLMTTHPYRQESYLHSVDNLRGAWMTGWVWNFGEGEWSREVDLVFRYRNGQAQQHLGLHSGPQGVSRPTRYNFALPYAETGYEWHGRVYQNVDDNRIIELLDLFEEVYTTHSI